MQDGNLNKVSLTPVSCDTAEGVSSKPLRKICMRTNKSMIIFKKKNQNKTTTKQSSRVDKVLCLKHIWEEDNHHSLSNLLVALVSLWKCFFPIKKKKNQSLCIFSNCEANCRKSITVSTNRVTSAKMLMFLVNSTAHLTPIISTY